MIRPHIVKTDTALCVTQKRPFYSQHLTRMETKKERINTGSSLTFSSDTTSALRRTESSPVQAEPARLLLDRFSKNGTAGGNGELQRPRHDCCITQSCFRLTVSPSLCCVFMQKNQWITPIYPNLCQSY